LIELGLIGSGIGRSMAPMLHETLGRLTGRPVRYVLHDLGPGDAAEAAALLVELPRHGVTGVNVTHPFKEHLAGLVAPSEPTVSSIGAVNTVRFDHHGPSGYNTDHSGFVRAYRQRFEGNGPGVVAQLGAGGFGRAAAFALAELGADAIRVHDPDRRRAERLARDLTTITGAAVTTHPSAEEASLTADGIVNCSPVGMHHQPGCPIDPAALVDLRWAFDAVYTPLQTDFLTAAQRAGADCMSGSELFFWQGIHAFQIFHQIELDRRTIRAATDVVQAEIADRTGA
jgi:shikimate dehydrogenase